MARGVFSLAVLVSLVVLAFILREITLPWQVGKEIQRHDVEIGELNKGVEETRAQGKENKVEIDKHGVEIARNRKDIDRLTVDVESIKGDFGAFKQSTEASARELRELQQRSSRDNDRLAKEVSRLKDATQQLEGRMTAIEEKLKTGPPPPENVQ